MSEPKTVRVVTVRTEPVEREPINIFVGTKPVEPEVVRVVTVRTEPVER